MDVPRDEEADVTSIKDSPASLSQGWNHRFQPQPRTTASPPFARAAGGSLAHDLSTVKRESEKQFMQLISSGVVYHGVLQP